MDDPNRTDTATKPERRSGLRSASTLLALPLVATIFIATIRSVRHFGEGWPTHAEHHLVAFMAAAVAISVIGLVLVAKPVQQGEVWAWWALLVTESVSSGNLDRGSHRRARPRRHGSQHRAGHSHHHVSDRPGGGVADHRPVRSYGDFELRPDTDSSRPAHGSHE